MNKIKFGPDGWQGIIAKDFTLANVAKVAYGIARWMLSKYTEPSVVIGYDSRFGGEMFMEAIAKILASKHIRVYIAEDFVSTPMVSFGVTRLKANCGIMLTAGHKPAQYHGIKLRGEHGGLMLDKDIRDIESLISSEYEFDLEMLNWNYFIENGWIHYLGLESIYVKNIRDHFDIEQLSRSSLRFGFDAMYGSTQRIFSKLMPDIQMFRCEPNPSFMSIPPEPVSKNLNILEEYIGKLKDVDSTFAISGDGERIAMLDENGSFLDSNHMLLLMLYCLATHHRLTGKVLVSHPLTQKVELLATHLGIEVERMPTGFNETTSLMLKENIMLAGDETGGIALGNYLPERDGVWAGLIIWEWLSKTGKKLSELVDEIYAITGRFSSEYIDIELNKVTRNKVIERCESNGYSAFDSFKVTSVNKGEVYTYGLGINQRLIVQAVSNEPVIRIYAEAEEGEQVGKMITAAVNTMKHTLPV